MQVDLNKKESAGQDGVIANHIMISQCLSAGATELIAFVREPGFV